MELEPIERKREKPQNSVALYVLLGMVVAMLALAGVAWVGFEGEEPQLSLTGNVSSIGLAKQISLAATDKKSGIRSVEVVLVQENKKTAVLAKSFPRQGYFNGAGPEKAEESFEVAAKSLGFRDGDAQLLVTVTDFSWLNWLKGNVVTTSYPVVIDTRPPSVSVTSSPQYIKAGGAGVVAYRLGEQVERHGLLINDIFYPGFPLPKHGEGTYGACIGLPFDTERLDKVFVVAVDLAGNEAKVPFGMVLHPRKIPTDQITVSDAFLAAKLPEFASYYPELSGTPVEQYLKVNNDIRKANYQKIKEICVKFSPERLWDGRFDRMEGSPRAGFADHRTYLYEGSKIDEQVHLGVDIAALQHFEVKAANRGVVVFAEYLGIYGNTVILDHGQGIFSLYSHLSQINATMGSMLEKGDLLGLSGATGMAGGDHLHFSMIVNGIFVDPREWWDPQWLGHHMLNVL